MDESVIGRRVLLPLVGEGGLAKRGRMRVLGKFQPSRGVLIRHAFAAPSPVSGRRESLFNYFNPDARCVMMLS